MKWNCTKYSDCKTWTVFDDHQTIASKLSQEHAEQIVREHNAHDQLVAACGAALLSANLDLGLLDTSRIPQSEAKRIVELRLLLSAALEAAKGGGPMK